MRGRILNIILSQWSVSYYIIIIIYQRSAFHSQTDSNDCYLGDNNCLPYNTYRPNRFSQWDELNRGYRVTNSQGSIKEKQEILQSTDIKYIIISIYFSKLCFSVKYNLYVVVTPYNFYMLILLCTPSGDGQESDRCCIASAEPRWDSLIKCTRLGWVVNCTNRTDLSLK